MKRFVLATAVICLFVLLTSCGNNDKFLEDMITEEATETTIANQESSDFEPVTDENGKAVTNSNGEKITKSKNYDIDDISILKSGKFQLTASMNIPNNGYVPMNIGVNGNRMAIKSNIAGIAINIMFTGENGYLIFPDKKLYCALPQVIANQFDISSMKFNDNMKLTSTTKEKLDGIETTCKTYQDDVSSVKYYMVDNTLLKIEDFDKNGNKNSEIIIDSLSPDINNSFFTIPKDCKKAKFSDIKSLFN